MNEYLLGIDVGTASSKAALVTPDGLIVRRATRYHEVSLPRPGWVEQHPETVWWNDIRALCADIDLAPNEHIAAVGVSGIGPCLAPCDENDRALRPAILYGVDTRARHEAHELDEQFGEQRILERGGSALSSQALGPKLLWLRRHEPDVWNATRRWHTSSSFIVARLTGEWRLDHHTASQCDPFYDLAANAWCRDWIGDALGNIPLPQLVWPSNVVGTVTRRASEETGILEHTPVIAGTIDAWAEATSAGVRSPGTLMLMYGSTMFFVLAANQPAKHASVWTTTGIDPGSLTHATGMATSGSLTAWLRNLLGEPSFEDLIEEAAAAGPGADGLLMLPYFAGERTPLLDPDARGTVTGLTLRHGRGHLYRAALEAIGFGARHNLETLSTNPNVRATAVGGGTQGGLWAQIVSDVSGVEQTLPVETLGAAYGDALLAAEGIGLVAQGTVWAKPGDVITPDPELRSFYDDRYKLYLELHAATRDIQHMLAGATD